MKRAGVIVAIVCLAVAIALTRTDSPCHESVADRTAAAMGHMFDGAPWNRMAADEVKW